MLVPEIDALAAVERLEDAKRENEELLDELEVIGTALLAEERLVEPTPVEELTPVDHRGEVNAGPATELPLR